MRRCANPSRRCRADSTRPPRSVKSRCVRVCQHLVELDPVGRGQLGGLARGECPAVGHQIGNGHIDLVAHRGNDRMLRKENRLGYVLGVESSQVLAAAPAAAQQNNVDAHDVVETPQSALATWSAAPSPCTRTGQTRTSATGQRRPRISSMSRIAAPVGLVTSAMRRGKRGRGRLRSVAKYPSRASFSRNFLRARSCAPRRAAGSPRSPVDSRPAAGRR